MARPKPNLQGALQDEVNALVPAPRTYIDHSNHIESIRTVPERVRLLCVLRFCGYSVTEIADRLAVPPGSIERALKSDWLEQAYDPIKHELLATLDERMVAALQDVALEVLRGKIAMYREARGGRTARWMSVANQIGNELLEMYEAAMAKGKGGALSSELQAVWEKTIRKNRKGEIVGTSERVRVAAPADGGRIADWSAQSAPGGESVGIERDAGEAARGEGVREVETGAGADGSDEADGGGVLESIEGDSGDEPDAGGETDDGDVEGGPEQDG